MIRNFFFLTLYDAQNEFPLDMFLADLIRKKKLNNT